MTQEDQVRSRFEEWLEVRIRDGSAPDPAQLCSDDPEILPALRSLIAHYEDIDGVLPSPSRQGPADVDPEAYEPPVVDNYRIFELLGVGGMGEAWEAEQLSPVCRRVALKVIKRGSDTAHVVSRFAAERQALAAMEHSAIAKVFDAGATEDGRPYFAMELVHGEPIDRFADQNRLSVRQRLELFASVCDGVQHAHQKGLIHRDLKPSNILVSLRDGSSGHGGPSFEPKLIDFGIAKAIESQIDHPDQTELTVIGQVVGTPAYMSPEQADLTRLDLDTRSDVYALGIVLYQLLVGVLPFAAGSLLLGERRGDAKTPSARLANLGARAAAVAARRGTKVNELTKLLRGEIDWIVMKALSPERDMRYASVADLAEDLRRSFRNEPVTAGPPSVSYRLRKLAQRHRVAVAGALTVTLAVVATLAGLGVGLQRALRAEAQATAESEVARRVSKFLVDAFRAGDPSYSGKQVAASDIVEQASLQIRQQLADEPEIRARLSHVLAEASLNLGELEQAAELASDAVALSTETLGADASDTVLAGSLEALILMAAGQLDEAEPRLRALLQAESAHRPGGLLEARIANDLGILLQQREENEESEALLRRALSIYRERGQETERDAIRTLHNLAYTRKRQGATEEAAVILREVLALQRQILTPPNTDIATTLNDLASATRALGDLEEAEALYRRALEQRQALLSPDHPDVAQSLNNVGSARFWAEDYEEAALYMKQAFDIWQVAYGGDHPRLHAALSNLAAVSRRGGRFDQAEDYYRQALAMGERLHGPDHVHVAQSLRRLGDLQIDAGQPDEAIATLERAIKIFDQEQSPSDPKRVTAVLSLATAFRASSQAPKAERLLRALAAVVEEPEQAARVREALEAGV